MPPRAHHLNIRLLLEVRELNRLENIKLLETVKLLLHGLLDINPR